MSLSGEGDEARVGHCRDRDELRNEVTLAVVLIVEKAEQQGGA
jgi:hypothetical protein